MPLPIITTAGDKMLADMLARAQEINVRARQADAERRVLMMQGNWRHLALTHAAQKYKVQAVRQAILAEIKTTSCVLRQLANRICVAYKVPPIRTLDKASEQSQQAFARVLEQGSIVTKAKQWERYAWACNVALIVPRVRDDPSGQGKRLDYEMILPDRAEVFTSDLDPMGMPVKVVYETKRGSDRDPDPIRLTILDAEGWRELDSKGRTVSFTPHNAGVCPAVPWRLEDPVDDWWCSHSGEGVVEASLEIPHKWARMDWVRNGQDRFREHLGAAGELLAAVPQQAVGSEGPIQLPIPPDAYKWEALDVNTPIDNHLGHIRAICRQVGGAYGVPWILDDFDPGTNADDDWEPANPQQHASLAELRTNAIEFHRRSERRLQWVTALVLRGMGHPDARLLPPDMVLERFAIEFPELTYVEHPKVRVEVATARVAAGLSSTFREVHREHPELTFDQARELTLSFAEEEGELNLFYIQHNIPRGADARLKTLAQLQGAQGGQASGDARQPEDMTDDDAAEPGRAAAADPSAE